MSNKRTKVGIFFYLCTSEKDKCNIMNDSISKGVLLNNAAIAGLALGAVSTAYLFAVQYLPQIIPSSIAVSLITTALWIAKFVGCIYILKGFMQRFVDSYDGAQRTHTLRLGVLASLFSALIFSAANLANILYISPVAIEQAFNQALSQYSSMMDSNTIAAIDSIKEDMPAITFFSNFIYCFLYGMVLSAILSRHVPEADPFAGFRNGGDENTSNIEEQ